MKDKRRPRKKRRLVDMSKVDNYAFFYPQKKSKERLEQLHKYLKEIIKANNIEHTYTAITEDYVVYYLYSEELPYESLFKNITSLHPDIRVKNIFYQLMGEYAGKASFKRGKLENETVVNYQNPAVFQKFVRENVPVFLTQDLQKK